MVRRSSVERRGCSDGKIWKMTWRDVPGWPRYEVNDMGLVRSRHMTVNTRGGALAGRKGRVLRLVKKNNGYLAVTLTKGTQRCQTAVHRLVALVFHGAPPHDNAQVLHFDGNKHNNAADNLRWGTPADNHADTELHGRRLKGELHPHAKLTEIAVRSIRNSSADASELANAHGVSREHIWAVRANRTWRHIL